MNANSSSPDTRESALEARRLVRFCAGSCAVVQPPERKARRRNLASAFTIADAATRVIVRQISTLVHSAAAMLKWSYGTIQRCGDAIQYRPY
jgi:hypothetical protein